jgi:hypothetical protein
LIGLIFFLHDRRGVENKRKISGKTGDYTQRCQATPLSGQGKSALMEQLRNKAVEQKTLSSPLRMA